MKFYIDLFSFNINAIFIIFFLLSSCKNTSCITSSSAINNSWLNTSTEHLVKSKFILPLPSCSNEGISQSKGLNLGENKSFTNDKGSIKGYISPIDVKVKIIAKIAGSVYDSEAKPVNEAIIKDGVFTILSLFPGEYDILFFPQGDTQIKYLANRWSKVVVNANEVTSGINYRLTPIGLSHFIDEVIVDFGGANKSDAQVIIQKEGCAIKDDPINLENSTTYVVDIPDNKSVKEMIMIFEKYYSVKSCQPNYITNTGTKN